MSQVKNLDIASKRGKRQVHLGIATAEGKQLLKGFDLNSRADLSSVLRVPYVLTPATGAIAMADFVPQLMLQFPNSATHVGLSCGFVKLDFETGLFVSKQSNVVNLPIDMTASDVDLLPASVPTGLGTSFHLLLVEFFQEINGVQYPLNNGSYNALTIVGVD